MIRYVRKRHKRLIVEIITNSEACQNNTQQTMRHIRHSHKHINTISDINSFEQLLRELDSYVATKIEQYEQRFS